MATRSFIARYNESSNDYTAIYCHWDGYPQGVGVTLRDNYHDDEAVDALLALGDISSLRDTLCETAEDAYSMRGEKKVSAKTYRYLREMEEDFRGAWCEYGYLWHGGEWSCYCLNRSTVNLYELEAANV